MVEGRLGRDGAASTSVATLDLAAIVATGASAPNSR
jgi:hypothetical protein